MQQSWLDHPSLDLLRPIDGTYQHNPAQFSQQSLSLPDPTQKQAKDAQPIYAKSDVPSRPAVSVHYALALAGHAQPVEQAQTMFRFLPALFELQTPNCEQPANVMRTAALPAIK